MKRHLNLEVILIFLGLASVFPYFYAISLGLLRKSIPEFLLAYFLAWVLYAVAIALVLKSEAMHKIVHRYTLTVIFGLAILFCGLLIYTRPSLSDDMYRYVWDGRVQAQGIDPYRYAPKDIELKYLRDREVWRNINRKSAVTVYPAAAELSFATLWRIFPDQVRWFQIFMAGMALLSGGLLIGILRDLGRSPLRVIIFLWAPLMIYETAHSAHLDALILPLIVGAWWARVQNRDILTGALLGVASAVKFYPAILLPVLWRPNDQRGRWQMPLAFLGGFLAPYLPYLFTSGKQVVGFLPEYLSERFNISPPIRWLLLNIKPHEISGSQQILLLATLITLALMSLIMVLRPALNAEDALRRCIWPIGIFTLLNPNLFSWYLLWLLPLLAVFLHPGQIKWRGVLHIALLRIDAWTGWWLFSGMVVLSYTFFIAWKPVPMAIHAQFWPLYAFLIIDLMRRFLPPGTTGNRKPSATSLRENAQG